MASASACTRPPASPCRHPAVRIRRPSRSAATPATLLAWTPGGLPDGLGRAVAKLPKVDHVVSVMSGTAWLTGSTDASGNTVDRPPAGLMVPLEAAGADPRAYAPFLAPADRA